MTNEKLVKDFIASRIWFWEHTTYYAQVRADLANLRSISGRSPKENPGKWEVLFRKFPEELRSNGNIPTREEWAATIALSLYALHQQGNDPTEHSLNQPGHAIGKAVRMIAPDKNSDEFALVRKKFNTLMASTCIEQYGYYLRRVVDLLKNEDIPLDYPQLAYDLCLLQDEDQKNRIKLKWGQDFYYTPKKESEETANG